MIYVLFGAKGTLLQPFVYNVLLLAMCTQFNVVMLRVPAERSKYGFAMQGLSCGRQLWQTEPVA